ncbi:MAG: ABC transporter ATP-binding protein [Planctomycetia bacterium]|nr:ABC transporter ATP-binding protein [Planctomycetia bacterium]
MNPTATVEVERLAYAWGRRRVLDGVTFSLAPGTTTVLLGENGAGKTTLLRLLAGLLRPAGGTVRVLGLDPVHARDRVNQRLGLVPDAPDAWGWMRPRDLHRFLAAHHPRWDDARAEALLARLRVPSDRSFRQMSRGEATKAMLAATLGHDPEVLLLDEPFGGLDPLAHDDVLGAVVDALATAPRTVLVATHDLDVATRLGDRVLVLADGRVLRDLAMDEASSPGSAGSRREALRSTFAAAVRPG